MAYANGVGLSSRGMSRSRAYSINRSVPRKRVDAFAVGATTLHYIPRAQWGMYKEECAPSGSISSMDMATDMELGNAVFAEAVKR